MTSKWTVLSGVLAVVMATAGGGCATVLKGMSSVRDNVELQGAMSDIQIWVDGKPVQWERMNTSAASNGVVQTGASIVLNPRKKASYELTFRTGGREATFTVHRKVSKAWLWFDILTTAGVGCLVDWATGYWYEFGDKVINVPQVMQQYGRPIQNAALLPPSSADIYLDDLDAPLQLDLLASAAR
jgi:hypothetical protein